MRIVLTLLLFYVCMSIKAQQQDMTEMKKAIDLMQGMYGVTFVYDSSLVTAKPQALPLTGNSLQENLKRIFDGTGIKWEIRNEYVLLCRPDHYTFSGYVCENSGETLINVTVLDLNTLKGTLSNEHGFFSITLPEGKHKFRFSYIGYQDVVKEVDLSSNYNGVIYLKESSTALKEVVVVADMNAPLRTTQTGKVSLTTEQLNTEFSLLSSPDLVKTLQSLPGVASGMELLSGMYVHGGKNDENLFLLDGTPLYQVNHLGGLFSAFNTDIIKNVDFYKSGFPARYGGRLSSVVDVRTKEGNTKEFHGTFSLGLLDGRIQFEGPIIKDKTSFNIAMRRSWADLITSPVFFLLNRSNPDDKKKVRYAFHDINGKITHHFSDNNKLSLSVYSGNDLLKAKAQQVFDKGEHYDSDFKAKWGNLTTALTWNCQITPKLSGSFTGAYSRNISMYDYVEGSRFFSDGEQTSMTGMERSNHSTIDDMGYRMEFDYRPGSNHHIRFGSNYLHHIYHPQNTASKNQTDRDTLSAESASSYKGNEVAFYAEDEMRLSSKAKLNTGLHYTLYQTDGKIYHSLEPRLAMSYQCSEKATMKVSYTEMSQFAHQLSNTYLNLPTDSWVPSTREVRPMRSRQVAAGIYTELPRHISLNVEGYYRTTSQLLEYDGGNSLMLPADNWDNLVKTGKGKSYGVELSLAYKDRYNVIEAGYTLSWSLQKFTDFYPDWYSSKFDNRHKLNIAFRHKFDDHIDAYAAWVYRSGDRATVPTQYVNGPSFPGTPDSSEPELIYEKPNNITLPAYHRLDLGVNFRRITKRGFERIWNISVYNAYCRMNAFYTRIERLPDGGFRGKGFGIFPIIPSFCYTLKF